MSRIRRRHQPGKRAIELTPLVDVSLILVVFMLLNNERGDLQQLPVSLPATSDAGATIDTPVLKVVIDRGGVISVAGKAVDIDGLTAMITPATTVSILADRDSRHGDVVHLVDRLRSAGAGAIYYASEELDDVW